MEIYRNSVQDLEFRFYNGRVLMDVDAVPIVSLKLNGVSLPSRIASHVGTGVYTVKLLYADTIEEGEITAEWTFTFNGVTTSKIEYHKVVTPYVDLNYLYELNENDDDIRWAEIFSRKQIDKYTAQSFGLHKDWVKSPGNGSKYLILPERIVTISHVYENDIEIWGDVQNGYDIGITRSAFALEAGGDTFSTFKQDASYEVWGEFGYKHVPEDVSDCARMLVDDYLCRDRSWKEKYVKKLSNGDWSVEFDGRVFSGTGNSIVDAILSDYVWHRMIVI